MTVYRPIGAARLACMRIPFGLLAAAAILVAASPLASPLDAQQLPWKSGDRPPTLAGFSLYEPAQTAAARLGAPVAVDTLGSGPNAAVAYTNRERGVSLVTSRLDGVAIVYV